MTDHVYLPDAAFDHTRLHLAPPNGLQGGAYFAMLYCNDAPLYVQTPKCTSRQGVVPGKRPHIDLMFSSHDVTFLEWLEALETNAVRLIHEKRNTWFSGGDLEKSDIEAGFTSPVRPYKGGKHYLIRAQIQPAKQLSGSHSCSVFDENERLVSVDHIKPEHQMYTVIEFQGIKFTARSYQIEVVLKQVLLVANVPIFQSCVIRKPNHTSSMSHAAVKELAQSNPETGVELPVSQEQEPPVSQEQEPPVSQEQEPPVSQEQELPVSQEQEPPVSQEQEPPVSQEQGCVTATATETLNETDEDTEEEEAEKCKDPGHKFTTHANDSMQMQEMQEVNLDCLEELERLHIKLKKPTEVYYTMYHNAKQKAKEFKKNAIAAYLEARQIKSAHMLEDNDSDSEFDEDEDD